MSAWLRPPDLDALSAANLKALVLALLARVSELERTVVAQRDEIARLKGMPARPAIKPSGMENATRPKPATKKGKRRGGGKKTARRVIHENRVIKAAAHAGSRFKGCEDFVARDLVFRPRVIRDRRERWPAPDGRTITAAPPAGVTGHFGGHRVASRWPRIIRVRRRPSDCWRGRRRSASRCPSARSCAC